MSGVELVAPPSATVANLIKPVASNDVDDTEDDLSPIEQVRLIVTNTDDPTLPVWTFRMWFLGVLSCALLSFLNQFFAYRTEPLVITQITVQAATLPIGRFMAAVLPTAEFRIPGLGPRMFSLNPGPFNMKEHVLICIFANAGSAFGSGTAYAVGIVNIIKAFYLRSISFFVGWLLIITTQFIGTIIAGTVNMAVAWWLLNSITNICQTELLPPDSPWTCPNDRVFFDASVIWGLAGPKRIFGVQGNYQAMNWFFLGGAVGPFLVWLLHKAFPDKSWIPLINLPVLLGATGYMPPATPLNYNAWVLVGTIFNFFVFRYRKKWWQRYNYVLSAAMDAGVAFMGVLLYFCLGMENKGLNWWGTGGEHCDLASCPTAKGISMDGCPTK